MVIALIVAAGSGERLGADRPKALVQLAGRSLLQWSVDLMLACGGADGGIERVVVALPPGVLAPPGTIGVEGGAVRSESVARALHAAGPGDPEDLVVVHDAARPLASPELVRRSLSALAAGDGGDGASLDAAIAAAPVADTIKRVQAASGLGSGDGDDLAPEGVGVVVETLDRSALWAVQTPQVFRRGALQRALDVPAEILARATDDAWLVERLGGRVAIVPSGSENLKITTPLDLSLAELLIASA
jgi:2-C-methyl-D-erythritol 4-phosphate cytidylyltransferase